MFRKRKDKNSPSSSDKYALLPEQFECPVTMEAVKEPAVLQCGHVFEKSQVTLLIDTYEKKLSAQLCCPLCRKEFEKTKVNYSLKEGWDALRSQLVTTETNFVKKEEEFKRLKTVTYTQLEEDNKMLRERSETISQLRVYCLQLEGMISLLKEEAKRQLAEERELYNKQLDILATQLNEQSAKELITERKIHDLQLETLRTETTKLENQLKELQAQNEFLSTKLKKDNEKCELLSLELNTEKEKSSVLEDRNKKLESHFFISHPGLESKSSNESLFSLAEKLQIIFEHQKNILRMFPTLEINNDRIRHEVKSGIYDRFTNNLNQIIAQKKNKKSAQETKEKLIKKCKADSIVGVDLTLFDAKLVGQRLVLIQQEFTQDMKAQDDIIQESDKNVKTIQKNTMEDFCKFFQLIIDRRTTLKKIAHEVTANEEEFEKLSIQNRLYSLSFFRTHLPSLQRASARSKQTVAFRTYVKERDYKKIEAEFKKLPTPTIHPKIDGYPIAQYAVINKEPVMISALLEAKADFNFIFTPPKIISTKYTCLTYLLGERKKYSHKKYGGFLPAQYDDMILGLINVMDIKTLNFSEGGDNALTLAIKMRHTDFVCCLLKRKIAVNYDHIELLRKTYFYDYTILKELQNSNIILGGIMQAYADECDRTLPRPNPFRC